ncbi:MAG: hypothetical protein ABI634_02950 [Acidobacteriota bacterium]
MSPVDLAPWPALLLASAVLGAAVWAFFVKTRPPRLAAPSMALWRRILDDPRERTWWERIRRAVSLALTAAIALLLVLSAVRPARRAGARTGRLTIAFDSSWSMGARTADGQTRWAHAVSEARALARSIGSDEVIVETTGQGVVEGPTADSALIALAFDRLRPEGGSQALELARSRSDDVVHFFTDGSTDRPIPPGVVVHSVFESAPNVAVTALSARSATSARTTAEAFLEIANMAPAQRVHLTMTREAAVIADRQLDMRAGEVVREIVPLPGNGARLHVRISAAGDALEADDEAVAWLAAADPLRVTVVTDHPETFVRLLDRDASIQPTFIRPSQWQPGAPDAWIFDGWLPAEAPAKPALYFDPPAAAWLGTELREEVAPVWSAVEAHPILDGVDALTVDVARVRMPVGLQLRPVGTSMRGTPLVSVVDTTATRAVVVGFGANSSNLMAAPAFPVLVGNALDWLAHPVPSASVSAGAIELPSGTASVMAPDGGPLPLHRAPDRVLTRLDHPGFYLVTAGGAQSVLALNVRDAANADLRRTTLAATAATSAPAISAARPWWIYAVVMAFVLLTLEWWTWQRRVTV